ncbi:MAG: hypothetical protein QXF35_02460 [Candidatus Bilamarchaeaceae archaeon]
MKEKISRLIELLAERESVTLKVDYLKGKKQDSVNKTFLELIEKMKVIDAEISNLTNMINSNNVQFYLFGFDELVATENLSVVPPEEKAIAIEKKEGPIFDIIKNRLKILKKNLEMRNELASIYHILLSMKDENLRKDITDAIRSQKPLSRTIECSDEKTKHLVRLLSRFGLYNINEKKYVVSREVIWLEGEEAKRMDGILAELARLEPELQWKNAQRQIKNFTEDEEKEFAEVQKKYLELLNLRDEIIAEYKKKEEALNLL